VSYKKELLFSVNYSINQLDNLHLYEILCLRISISEILNYVTPLLPTGMGS
jgi:hypothetical protein